MSAAECTMTHAEFGNCPTTIVSTPTVEQQNRCAEMDAVPEPEITFCPRLATNSLSCETSGLLSVIDQFVDLR